MNQVTKNHYDFNKYCTKERWASYWHQLNGILSFQHKNALIIGDGDGLMKHICQNLGINVDIADIASDLSPNYLVSVNELTKVIDKKYPVVLCCQVLEHLPFDKFELSINELSKVCSDTCIISLPQDHIPFYLRLGTGVCNINKVFCFYKFWNKHQFDGEHYWELGGKGYSLRKIRRILSKYFQIEKDYTVKENTYHHFFICKKP